MSLFLQICAALGGLTFLGGIITALAMWRKSKAEAKKFGADAPQVLTDTALKPASVVMAELKEQAKELKVELAKTRAELQAVREHMDVLEDLLRLNQIPAPKFVWPAPNGAA